MRTLLILLVLVTIGYLGVSYQRDNNSKQEYNSAVAALEQGNKEKAVAHLSKAIDVKPFSLPPYLIRAQIYIDERQYLKAIADLETVLHLDSTNEQAHQKMAQIFLKQNKLQEAYLAAQRAMQLNPQNIDSSSIFVEVLINMNQIDLASQYLAKIILQEPNNIKSKLLYSRVLVRQGYTSAALDQLEEVLASSPNNLAIKQQLGLAYFEMGNLNLALPHLQTIEAQQQNVEDQVYEYLAEIYISNNNQRAALEVYQKLIQQSPSAYPKAYKFIANYQYEHEKWSEAHLTYLQLIAINPNDLEAKTKLGEIALQRNNLQDALKWFGAAFNSEALSHQQAYKIAVVYLNEGQFEKSLEWLNKAITLANHITYAHLKGLLLIKTGKSKQALKFLLAESKNQDEQQNPWRGYAAAQAAILVLNQPVKATDLLTDAINSLPSESIDIDQAYVFLAMIHLQNNQLALAQDALTKIHASNNKLSLHAQLLLALKRNRHQAAISLWEQLRLTSFYTASDHQFAVPNIVAKFMQMANQFANHTLGNQLPKIIADLYLQKALNSIATVNYVQAEVALLKATEITPKKAELYFYLGNTRAKQKQFSQAISDYNTAHALKYDTCSIAYGLGKAYVALEQYHSAKQSMQQCNFLNNLPAMKLKASNLLALNDEASALALYKNIIDIDEEVKNIAIFMQYAEILHRINKTKYHTEIIEVLTKVIEHDAKQTKAFELKAELLYDSKSYSQALIHYRRAIELGASVIPTLTIISEIQQVMFDEPGQMHTLSTIISQQPNHLQSLQRRAALLIKQKKYTLAITDLSTLIMEYGFRQEWLENRAESYEILDNYIEGINDYSILLNLEAKSFTYRFKRAMLFYLAGNMTSALTDTNTLLTIEPKNAQALLLRANIYQSLNDYQLAIADFLLANQQKPLSIKHLHTLADAYYQIGELAKTTGVLENLLTYNSNDQEALIKLATVMVDLGKHNDVPAILAKIDNTNSNIKVVRLEGIMAERRAIYPLAIEYYNRYLSLNPEDLIIRLKLAGLLVLIGQLDQGIDALDYILVRERDNSAALVLRSKIYKDQGYFKDAIYDATQALRIDSNNALAYEIRGISYFSSQQFELALADLEFAAQLNPNNVKLHEDLAQLYIFLNRTKNALKQLSRAIKISADPAKLYLERGYIYQISEQYGKALKDYDRVRKLAPENADVLSKIATVRLLQENFEQAIQAYYGALDLTDNKGDIYYYLAMAHLYKKEFAKAERLFERAIDEKLNIVKQFKNLNSTVSSFEKEINHTLPPNIVWLLEHGVKLGSASGLWYN